MFNCYFKLSSPFYYLDLVLQTMKSFDCFDGSLGIDFPNANYVTGDRGKVVRFFTFRENAERMLKKLGLSKTVEIKDIPTDIKGYKTLNPIQKFSKKDFNKKLNHMVCWNG